MLNKILSNLPAVRHGRAGQIAIKGLFGFFILFFVGAFLFVFLPVLAWTEPTAIPPGENVNAPVNVGTTDQSKSGALNIYGSGTVDVGFGACANDVVLGTNENAIYGRASNTSDTSSSLLLLKNCSGGTCPYNVMRVSTDGKVTLGHSALNLAGGSMITGTILEGTTGNFLYFKDCNGEICRDPGFSFTVDHNGLLKTTGGLQAGSSLGAPYVPGFVVDASGNVTRINGVTYTWPTGQASGSKCLANDGNGNLSWGDCGSGSGTPGGDNTQVQFNDSSSFGGDAGLTYSKDINKLSVNSGTLGVKADGATPITASVFTIYNSTDNAVLQANAAGQVTLATGGDVGLGAGSGRIIFTENGATDIVNVNTANLGIGSTALAIAPPTPLYVDGSEQNVVTVNSSNLGAGGNPTGGIALTGSGSNQGTIGFGEICAAGTNLSLDICAESGRNIDFGTNGTTNMTILSGGNVGIGTIAPSVKLHNIGMTMLGASNLRLNPGENLLYGNIDDASAPTSALLLLQNKSVDKFKVDSLGDLSVIKGISYTWPASQSVGEKCLVNAGDAGGTLSWGDCASVASGVSQIVAGENVVVSPPEGTGIVTISASGGSGTPGGDNTQVQFNDNGSFGGNSRLAFNKDTGVLTVDTLGAGNLFIGQTNASTNGQDNTFIGDGAGFSTTTGVSNIAIGTGALYWNQTGFENTAVGRNALSNNTATNNTAIGESALYANTTGDYNSALGRNALLYNQEGRENTAIGHSALMSLNGGVANGSYNTAVGNGAGFSTITAGSHNSFFGWYASVDDATAQYRTVIGASAVGTVDNSVTLGRDSDVVYVPGSLGVKTDAPANAELDVNGNIRIRGTGTALPSASAAYRGVVYLLQGGAGVADKLYVCMKTSSDTYAWVLIGRGN